MLCHHHVKICTLKKKIEFGMYWSDTDSVPCTLIGLLEKIFWNEEKIECNILPVLHQ